MTTPLRRFVKRTFPWAVPVYEKYQVIKSGLMPLREFSTPHGFTLIGPDCGFVAHQASGAYESKEIEWMAGVFSSRRIGLFVDAGANIGLYTMLALEYGIRTIAVEPQPKNVRAIRAGLRANRFICRIDQAALSDTDGMSTIFGLSSGSASLVKDWHTESSWIRRKVRTTTLDTVLRGFGEGRLLIKLDLEGNEWPALLGAQETLARTPKPIWMVEIVDFAFKGGVHPHRADIFMMFVKHGYAGHEITPGNWVFEWKP